MAEKSLFGVDYGTWAKLVDPAATTPHEGFEAFLAALEKRMEPAPVLLVPQWQLDELRRHGWLKDG